MTCRSANQSNRSNGDTLVHDRNTVFLRDILPGLHQILGQACHLIIYILTENIQITVGAVQQVNTHGNGTHVQIFLLYHLIGFENLGYINHSNSCF